VLRIVGVHLKAKQDGLEARREQWALLRDLVQRQDREFPAETNLLIAGDFNVTGGSAKPRALDRHEEERELQALLAQVGLRPLALRGGCSAYWDGERRDAWREATQLDFVWVRGLDKWLEPATQALPMGPCARHACAQARSTKAKPDPDLEWISDHCPLVVDFHRVASAPSLDHSP
jgi:endonuclease/exonuclease/phosphatase family metal-dependent hydrolase